MQFDWIIRGGNPFGLPEGTDIAIRDGKIVATGVGLLGEAGQTIDATGKLIAPSFVDSHMHLDKALMGADQDAANTWDAVRIMLTHAQNVSRSEVREDVKRRARRVIDWEIANGSGTLKSHVYANELWGMESASALWELKEEYAGRIDILSIVPWPEEPGETQGAEFDALAAAGQIDVVGGYPYGMPDFREKINRVFEKALQYGLPIDLHVDERDCPDCAAFAYVCQKTIETGMQGRVTCGHVTTLNAVDDETAARVIALAAEAEMHIVTLPSCNMYLLGRDDHQPIRRGVTRIREFLQAGVNIAYASDNVRDPFRPFGNGDMLEEGNFAAQVMQYGMRELLHTVFEMGTYHAAKNCLLQNYGVTEGCLADLVIFDAPDCAEALKSISRRLYVFKGGRMVAKNGVLL